MSHLSNETRADCDVTVDLRGNDALTAYTPSELVLLFPDCVSLSFPDAFVGSRPALVTGRHVDAMNVTPRLVHYALAALVARGDVSLSRKESPARGRQDSPARALASRRVTLLMHASSPAPSTWPNGSLESLLLQAAQRDDEGAGLANAIANCIGGVSSWPHGMLYERLLEGLVARGVVETSWKRRLLLFRVRQWHLAPAVRETLHPITSADVARHLSAFDRMTNSYAGDIKRSHDTAIEWCTDRGD